MASLYGVSAHPGYYSGGNIPGDSMPTATEPTTATVAEELVAFCRARRNIDAINTLYSPDIVSIESMGNETMPREQKGIDAVRGKNQWWVENNEVHGATVDGPFVGSDDKFAVYYSFDCTFKPTGKRNNMEEMALYTVKEGKVVREQFFYRTDAS
ncbi:MAG: SnoaL-like domain-containing protein [Gemmatimonadaceae bacterium]